jgi:hypothetical protein
MRTTFPRLRWAALAWLAVWTPAYAAVWGWRNFLLLSDISVFLSCAGLWLGSALLLSSQAVASLAVGLAWGVDFLWRAAAGQHLIGGTDYMWDPQYPLWVRLLSFYHLGLPVLLVWSVHRTGYDFRGWRLQSGIAVVVMIASRWLELGPNFNFVERDPILGRTWGPAPVHLLVISGFLIGAIYWPTHRLLASWLPRRP